MSWLWLLPTVVMAAGAVALTLAARGAAVAAQDLAASARGLDELRADMARLDGEITAFTQAADAVGRREARTGRG